MYATKKSAIGIVMLLLASVAVPAFAEEAEPVAAEQNFPAIRVTAAKERLLIDRIIVTGTIKPVEEVYVQPQVDGLRIESLKADVGDVVKEGDVLATLSDDALILQKSQLEANRAKALAVGAQLQAQLAEAKANGDEAGRQADRADKLAKSGTISRAQADQAAATATAAKARVNSAEQALKANAADVNVVDAQIKDIDLKLARTGVKTPVSGLVSARNARIGAIAAGAGQPLFTIIRDNSIELNADVAEGDLLKLAPGQKVNLKVAGLATPVAGTVRVVDPVVDATTRLGSVKIAIADEAKARTGMYASAEVILSERRVLSLPLTSVTAEKGAMYVRKVSDGRVNMQKVTIGVQDGDFLEIASGLTAEDMVVEKAGAYVRDGDRVTPVKSDNAVSN